MTCHQIAVKPPHVIDKWAYLHIAVLRENHYVTMRFCCMVRKTLYRCLSGLSVLVLYKNSFGYNSLLSEHVCDVYNLWLTYLSANTNKHLLAASARYVIKTLMLSREHNFHRPYPIHKTRTLCDPTNRDYVFRSTDTGNRYDWRLLLSMNCTCRVDWSGLNEY